MNNKDYNIAIVGATGLVGRTMLKVLEERNFRINQIFLFATERSRGMTLNYKNLEIPIIPINENNAEELFKIIDIALFSAGKEASIRFVPIAIRNNCLVIDNGSYWRMHQRVPLIVPECNAEIIKGHNGIIANPNCSTIQLMLPLKIINDNYNIKRVIVSTYQSISGGGQKALSQMNDEISGKEPSVRVSKHQIAYNAIFHQIESDDGFSIEETKMINESKKILNYPNLKISTTCVRLPFIAGHGESVNVDLEKEFDLNQVRELFTDKNGIVLIDHPQNEDYPTIRMAQGTDNVYIGRFRRDNSSSNGLHFWITADNVRKGAATNAVQIAEYIINNDLLAFNYYDFER